MNGLPERARRLQTSAIQNEDMTELTVVAARRWIRAHESLLAAVEQTFDIGSMRSPAREIYEQRVHGYREHARYWHDVLTKIESRG
ncbi:MAG TPA: hypothetical protein VIA06_05155 [Candidatus Dormibacteraeota bacterium]|jgi:hypothetical protein|nr:hypothetical protein [Candidatus Dormibacteraeota bacterium]